MMSSYFFVFVILSHFEANLQQILQIEVCPCQAAMMLSFFAKNTFSWREIQFSHNRFKVPKRETRLWEHAAKNPHFSF